MRRLYVYRPGHPAANERGFVNAEELGIEQGPLAKNAPVMAGRFYENTATLDGVDIGSRKKHADYMKRTGLAPASDFASAWQQPKADTTSHDLRNQVEREVRRVVEMPQARYDRERAERSSRRG